MNLFVKLGVVAIFFFPFIAGRAGTPEKATVAEQPPAQTTEPWEIKVSAPGWLANVSGFTGFHGVNPYVNVGIGQILKHTNFIFVFGGEGEVRKGRFGVLANLGYLDAQAGVSGKDLVSRTGLGMQQFLGGFFGSYSGEGGGLLSIFRREWGPVVGIEEAGKVSDRPISAVNPRPASEEYDRVVTELHFAVREFAINDAPAQHADRSH